MHLHAMYRVILYYKVLYFLVSCHIDLFCAIPGDVVIHYVTCYHTPCRYVIVYHIKLVMVIDINPPSQTLIPEKTSEAVLDESSASMARA